MDNVRAEFKELKTFAVALPKYGKKICKVEYEPDMGRWCVSVECYYLEPGTDRISPFYGYHSDHANKDDAENSASAVETILSALFPDEEV